MHVHWKSLLVFGLIFWILLCLTDIFGAKSNKYVLLEDYEELYENSDMRKYFYDKLESDNIQPMNKIMKFGWTLFVWNMVTLLVCVTFCYWIRTATWVIWRVYYRFCRTKATEQVANNSNIIECDSNLSKIPVMMKHSSSRLSDTHLKFRPKLNTDGSCPNLLPKRSPCNVSALMSFSNPKCQTLYKNSRIFSTDGEGKFNKHLEIQCNRLREEMARIQTNALKEHALLSRKIETATREKKEFTKQMTIFQKENRAAKQQIEELLQEKGVLIKRLDSTTKEFKASTKAKKFALTKLEETTSTVENLKQQLEQVTRDKEILENKLKVLECEYEKLQERVRVSSQRNFTNYHENTPERDTNGRPTYEHRENQTDFSIDDGDYKIQEQSAPNNMLCSVSQTELDMKKIEIKIKQLERNLENFNAPRSDINFKTTEIESDASISLQGTNTDPHFKSDDDLTDNSEVHFPYSPALRYWGGRAGDMIHAFAHKVNDRMRLLDNIRENDDTEIEEYSGEDSTDDGRTPKRIVSSSLAFQRFLRGLQSSCNIRNREFLSQCDIRI